VLPQGLGTLPHVINRHDIQANVSPGMGEGFGKGINQTSLDTVPWTNRDPKPSGRSEVPVGQGRESESEGQENRTQTGPPMSLSEHSEEVSHRSASPQD
jgi:hypothetical protein